VEPGVDFAREAERVQRLAADRELVERIMWAGYLGPEWGKLRRALAEYGVAVMTAWIRSGRIFVECKKSGFGGIAKRRPDDDEEASGLAGETVAHSLGFFRDRVLIPGRWDWTKGASLRTYFVGACVRHFPNVYLRSYGDDPFDVEDGVLDSVEAGDYVRPDKRSELASAVRSVADAELREILLYEAEGYTQGETAVRLNVTRFKVEGKLRRFRESVDAHARHGGK
jgi:hypothetical protein